MRVARASRPWEQFFTGETPVPRVVEGHCFSNFYNGNHAYQLGRRKPQTHDDALAWPVVTKENKPWTRWWWLGSAVDKENLTALLEQYHSAAGLGGVEICPIYGAKGFESRYVDYLSPKWVEMLGHTTSEGKRLDLGVDLTTGTGWPFGGPAITPAEASCKVVIRKDAAGKYTATAQSGIQKVKRAAPGGEGWVVDPYSTRALGVYLAAFDRAFEKLDAPVSRAEFHDSFEYYGANWTPDFLEKFKELRGYDLGEHLAAAL